MRRLRVLGAALAAVVLMLILSGPVAAASPAAQPQDISPPMPRPLAQPQDDMVPARKPLVQPQDAEAGPKRPH